MKIIQNVQRSVLVIASVLVFVSGNASANSFGLGVATFSSPGVYGGGGTSKPISSGAPVLVMTGDGWYHETVGPDTMTFLVSNDILGWDFNGTVWSNEFALVDVAVDFGYRIRIIHFQGATNTAWHYNSWPIHTTFSKKLTDGLTPYATVGFGPVGYFDRKNYGRYNSFEAGVDWQFADSWRLSASYNKTHDETSPKSTNIRNPIYQHDSTMMTGNIYFTW